MVDPAHLTQGAREAIASAANANYVSSAVAGQLAIKKALGRLDMPGDLAVPPEQERIEVLPSRSRTALSVADLQLHHQDAFDRMHAAQARLEGHALITRDARTAEYDVPVLTAGGRGSIVLAARAAARGLIAAATSRRSPSPFPGRSYSGPSLRAN